MGLTVLRGLLNDIKAVQCFSIIADEAMDLSHTGQLTLCIRWVDNKLSIHEDPSFMYLKRTQIHLLVL